MKDPSLWARLKEFSVDPGPAELSFVQRLARDNGWARAYAEEVYEEYLKFVYLMAVSDGIRTPSDPVDQAWHLHLAYSHSYWADLCGKVLNASIHHGPTQGGKSESRRYREAYADTLAAYLEEFGHTPMPRIWPPVEQRFRHTERYERVNTARSFVVRRRALAVGLAALVLGLVAAVSARADWSRTSGAIGTLALIVGIPVFAFAALWIIERFGRGLGGGPGGGLGCSGGGCGGGCGSC